VLVRTTLVVCPLLFVPSDLAKIDRPLRVLGPIAALCVKCAFCARSGRCVKGRRRRMRGRPWFLVRHACLELRRLMPAGRPCQVGAGLLPPVHPSPMLCCVSLKIIVLFLFFIGLISHMGELKPFLLIRGCCFVLLTRG